MPYTYAKWKGGRHWAVYDPRGEFVTLCVYRKGAKFLASLLDRLAP